MATLIVSGSAHYYSTYATPIPIVDAEVEIQGLITVTSDVVEEVKSLVKNPLGFFEEKIEKISRQETKEVWWVISPSGVRTDSAGNFRCELDRWPDKLIIRGVLKKSGEPDIFSAPYLNLPAAPVDIEVPIFFSNVNWHLPKTKCNVKGKVMAGSSPAGGAIIEIWERTNIVGRGTANADGTFFFKVDQECIIGSQIVAKCKKDNQAGVSLPKMVTDRDADFLSIPIFPSISVSIPLGIINPSVKLKGRVVHPSLPHLPPEPVYPAKVTIFVLPNSQVRQSCETREDGSFEMNMENVLAGSFLQPVIEQDQFKHPGPIIPYPYPAEEFSIPDIVVWWPSLSSLDLLGWVKDGIPIQLSLTGPQLGPLDANISLSGDVGADLGLSGKVSADLGVSGKVGADVGLSGKVGADLTAAAEAKATLAGDDQHPLKLDLSFNRLPKGKLKLGGLDIGFYLFSWRIFSIKVKGEAQLEDAE